MFADGLVAFLNDKNLIQHVPLIAQPFDPDESYLDEVVGYTVAALGARARSVARALQERCKSVMATGHLRGHSPLRDVRGHLRECDYRVVPTPAATVALPPAPPR